MKGPLHTVGFLWCCFLTGVVSDKVLPPENVRLGWKDDLYPELSWTHPNHSMQNCRYHIVSTIKDAGKNYPASFKVNGTDEYWTHQRVPKGGFLHISIQTICSGRISEAVIVGLNDTDIPLSCVIRSSTLTQCTWDPPASAQLSFFYSLGKSFQEISKFDKLRECPHYNSKRTGCDLKMKMKMKVADQAIIVVLNGTLGNGTIRNIYPSKFVPLKLPPLNWTVKDSKEQFLISWTPPEFDSYWEYIISYTKCNNTGSIEISDSTHSRELDRVAECPYRISMRGVVEGIGETEWTPDKHYGAVSVTNPVLFAVVLIPLVLAVLVVLSSLWCMKNKDKLFPKVPQPNSELFKDLINNNNKMNVHNFPFPKEEEEECPVILVLDPNQTPL